MSWTLGQLLASVLSDVFERPGPPALTRPSQVALPVPHASLPPGTLMGRRQPGGLVVKKLEFFLLPFPQHLPRIPDNC